METLSEKFKLVALQNYEFQQRQNTNVKWTFLRFLTIKTAIETT